MSFENIHSNWYKKIIYSTDSVNRILEEHKHIFKNDHSN